MIQRGSNIVAVLVALLFVAVLPCVAQDALTIAHSSGVRALHRSGDILWVGTGGGLYVYNLSTDRIDAHYVTGSEILSSSIRAIERRRDTVYIATDDGLSVVVEGEVVLFGARGRGIFDRIRTIDFGLDETLFLGTYGHGVTVVRGERSWRITREDSLLDDKVYGVHQEENSTVYFATSMGLCAFRDGAWVGFQAGAGIPRGEIRALIPSRSVGYYLLVAGRGVYSFNGYKARGVVPRDLFEGDVVECITLDAVGRLWAAARYGGIAVMKENGTWKRIGDGDPRVDDREWTTAHADEFGTVFFGARDGVVIAIADDHVREVVKIESKLPTGSVHGLTVDPLGGVVFLCGGRVHACDGDDGFPGDPIGPPGINALSFAPDSSLWLAGRWGVYRLNRDRTAIEEFRLDARGRDPSFVDIAFDDLGHLWVAEQRGDLYRFDGELWMRIGDGDNVAGLGNMSLAAGSDGGIWAVGDTTCANYRGGRWGLFPGASLVDLVRAPNGVMTGLVGRGLLALDERGRWRSLDLGSGTDSTTIDQWLGQNPATSMAFDEGGRVYIGTSDGIVAVGPDGVSRRRSTDGIGGKTVASLVVEGKQWLWVGFDRDGLARIPLRSFW